MLSRACLYISIILLSHSTPTHALPDQLFQEQHRYSRAQVEQRVGRRLDHLTAFDWCCIDVLVRKAERTEQDINLGAIVGRIEEQTICLLRLRLRQAGLVRKWGAHHDLSQMRRTLRGEDGLVVF